MNSINALSSFINQHIISEKEVQFMYNNWQKYVISGAFVGCGISLIRSSHKKFGATILAISIPTFVFTIFDFRREDIISDAQIQSGYNNWKELCLSGIILGGTISLFRSSQKKFVANYLMAGVLYSVVTMLKVHYESREIQHQEDLQKLTHFVG